MADSLSSDLASLRIDRSAARGLGRRSRRPSVRKLLVAGLFVLAVAVVWPHVAARAFPTKVRLTEIARVSPVQASTVLSATGYVVPRVISHVGPTVTGRIVDVAVVEGSDVQTGDVLMELDPVEAQRALVSARANALASRARGAAARAELAEIEVQIARQRRLARIGASPRANLEDLEARANALRAAADAALADARAAESAIDVARVSLDQRRIVAPITGRVITKPPDPGDIARPDAELLQIADMRSLVVEADVPETRLGTIRIGSPCEIALDAFPNRPLRGEASEIGQRIDRARATVTVRVRFVDSTEGVLPEMAARVSFLDPSLPRATDRRASRVVVPREAVTTRNGAEVVFVADRGVARMRRVRLGPRTRDGYELVRGPTPGTRVVARPPASLHDGERIAEGSEG